MLAVSLYLSNLSVEFVILFHKQLILILFKLYYCFATTNPAVVDRSRYRRSLSRTGIGQMPQQSSSRRSKSSRTSERNNILKLYRPIQHLNCNKYFIKKNLDFKNIKNVELSTNSKLDLTNTFRKINEQINKPLCCFVGNSRNPSVDIFLQKFLFKVIFTGSSPLER